MTTLAVAVTCAAFTVNVALVWPAATTTLFGATAKSELLVASVTNAFPVGAAEANVTVAVEDAGPIRLPGFNVTDDTALDTIRNRFVLTVVPAADADTATGVVCVTGAVVAVNVALV